MTRPGETKTYLHIFFSILFAVIPIFKNASVDFGRFFATSVLIFRDRLTFLCERFSIKFHFSSSNSRNGLSVLEFGRNALSIVMSDDISDGH